MSVSEEATWQKNRSSRPTFGDFDCCLNTVLCCVGYVLVMCDTAIVMLQHEAGDERNWDSPGDRHSVRGKVSANDFVGDSILLLTIAMGRGWTGTTVYDQTSHQDQGAPQTHQRHYM